jgi:hypothetical protein
MQATHGIARALVSPAGIYPRKGCSPVRFSYLGTSSGAVTSPRVQTGELRKRTPTRNENIKKTATINIFLYRETFFSFLFVSSPYPRPYKGTLQIHKVSKS